MKQLAFFLLASASFWSCQSLKSLTAVHVRVSYDLHSEDYIDSLASVPYVKVFFKSDSLHKKALEDMANVAGLVESVIYFGSWEQEGIPVPTVYDSVATLTAVSELKANYDSLAALGEVDYSFDDLYLLKKHRYSSHPGEMIQKLRKQADELGATAIIVTEVHFGLVRSLAIYVTGHSSYKNPFPPSNLSTGGWTDGHAARSGMAGRVDRGRAAEAE